jgi:hypothetical protein
LNRRDNKTTIQYYCAKCRAKEDLLTVEQKNDHNEVVGMIVLCHNCTDSVKGKRIEISFVGKDDFLEEIMDNIFDEAGLDINKYNAWN